MSGSVWMHARMCTVNYCWVMYKPGHVTVYRDCNVQTRSCYCVQRWQCTNQFMLLSTEMTMYKPGHVTLYRDGNVQTRSCYFVQRWRKTANFHWSKKIFLLNLLHFYQTVHSLSVEGHWSRVVEGQFGRGLSLVLDEFFFVYGNKQWIYRLNW